MLLLPPRKRGEFPFGRQQLKTGTGGARAPLSEILPSARGARFVRMTKKSVANDASNLTPDPFPWWKGNRIKK
jgi:hypothetical protein